MKRITMVLATMLLAACVHQDRYVEQIEATEVPQDEAGRKHLCGWLRGEEARQTSIASMAQGPYAGLVVAVARRHVAAIEQKKADAACDMPFMPEQHPAPVVIQAAPTSTKRNPSELQDCVAS